MKAIVVGGGAYGLACAERMARAGATVELVEQDEPAGARAASSGRTRVLRYEYGDRAIFSELTLRARDRWRELERLSGERLFDARGVLHLASPGGAFEERSLEVVSSLGLEIETARRRPRSRGAGRRSRWTPSSTASGRPRAACSGRAVRRPCSRVLPRRPAS